jgi:Na+-transporting NADH:ubiquinone oxidoreductase subunit NqrC
MKLNNTQIKALAQEVLNKIPDVKNQTFTKEQKIKFTKIINEYNKIDTERIKLVNKLNDIKDNLKELNIFDVYLSHDCVTNINKLEKRLKRTYKPSIETIIQKITLETIFETKDSMNDFIDNLVKQYSK